MKLVLAVVVGDEADVVDAQLAFHLNAGVDFVIATDQGPGGGASEILEAYAREGHVRRIPADPASEDDLRTHMLGLAATEHGADWVLTGDADEFWWPRGESLKDVLAAIPPRYEVVQALVRVFPPRPGDEPFVERMTVRPALREVRDEAREPLPYVLRPVYRADPRIVVEPGDGTGGGARVPLRAWYPIELLRFPFRSLEQAEREVSREPRRAPRSALEAEALEAYGRGALEEWYATYAADQHLVHEGAESALVPDERLRDALRALRRPDSAATAPPPRYVLPGEGAEPLVLRVPDIVDDASYAVECAAVGEVDLVRLDGQIRELESRIAWLEARFWPRVRRTLSRVVRR